MFSEKIALPLSLSPQEWAVTQWRGVANFIGMMYGYPDPVPAIEKFDESRVLGPAPFKESTADMQYKYRKEFMEWLTDPLTKKVTVSTIELQTEGVATATGDQQPCIPPRLADPRLSTYVICFMWGRWCVVH